MSESDKLAYEFRFYRDGMRKHKKGNFILFYLYSIDARTCLLKLRRIRQKAAEENLRQYKQWNGFLNANQNNKA